MSLLREHGPLKSAQKERYLFPLKVGCQDNSKTSRQNLKTVSDARKIKNNYVHHAGSVDLPPCIHASGFLSHRWRRIIRGQNATYRTRQYMEAI